MASIILYASLGLAFFASYHHFRDILHFKTRDLQNVYQSHDVQHSQWYHSLANTRLTI